MEFVLVVRRRDLMPQCSPQGFLPLDPDELEARVLRPSRERGFFVERREAEACPAWKQPIPYVVVASEDRYLLLERLPAQGEARLHGKLSIGVGGHVNPEDRMDPTDDGILAAARREIAEELWLPEPILEQAAPVPIGLINDDSNPVGAVHLGIVFGLRLDTRPRIREEGKMRGTLTPLVDLRNLCETSARFESWSQAILAARGWEQRF